MRHYVKEDMAVEVYDYVRVDTLEDGDNVTYNNDVLEQVTVMDETDTIMVRGYSHISGETATYFIPVDTEVGLWTA
jgi:hypothetical protein